MLAASFWLLTVMACLFAAIFGGREGRWFVGLFLSSVVLTIPAQLAGSWHATQFWLAMVDILLLAGLVWLMLRATCYWPIWAAASQLLTVLTHCVTLLLSNFSDRIYAGLSTVWVIPLLLFTIIGIELDRKARHDRAYAA
ncbi:hypothetical protein LL253_12630 [Sphingobium soli]|uniref:Uncharacterized protein n=1 Tax=Sphingobium soli TaxID=1591116 RepID=A0ABS8H4S4_9SPHN|nr:hypothetical protein [Sphingobium soli]MCC4233530.1 hypothetical protein [Sphingobium soli]|tara:strand:+ start:1524 stop:1943 length:420 start_codon:yes stop_codon:yes gene_type:complete